MKKFLLKITSALVAFTMLAGTAFGDANSLPGTSQEVSEDSQQEQNFQTSESKVFLQDNMRAVFITPEVDFTEENIADL